VWPFIGIGFYSDKRSIDACRLYCTLEILVLCGFHGDLCKVYDIAVDLRKLVHQLKPFFHDRQQFLVITLVTTMSSQLQILEDDQVKVIIG